MEDVIGQLYAQEPGEVSGVWHIPNFLSLPEEEDKWFRSSPFLFRDSCWCLRIYPNGETLKKAKGSVGVYLCRLNCDSPVTVNLLITTRIGVRGEEKIRSGDAGFTNKLLCLGFPTFLKRSDLQTAMSPSDTLKISYTVKSVDRQPFESTLCTRLWNISLRWNDILNTEKRTDVVLKLNDGEIQAHRVILESSSEVFARMFDADMQESLTGDVSIEDATKGAFQVVLSYIYGGDPKGLSCENVCDVYKVAHKYELLELTKFCTKFIEKTMCVDTVCEVISLADLYQETTLMKGAKAFFAKNKSAIFKTEKWKAFKRDNSTIACQFLECVLEGDV